MKMNIGPTRPRTVTIDDASTDILNSYKYQDSFLFHLKSQVSHVFFKNTQPAIDSKQ